MGRPKVKKQYDYVMLGMTILIAMFGVLMIYSASSYTSQVKYNGNPYRFVVQLLLGLSVGVVGMLVASNIDYRLFLKSIGGTRVHLVHIIYAAALVMQTLVLIPHIGIERNGARRWLGYGPLTFQPSEITKIAVILFIAYEVYRSRQTLDTFRGFIKIMFYIMPSIGLIAWENLSTAIIVSGISVGMCFVASRRKGYFVWCVLALAALVVVYILCGQGFRAARVTAWMHVETDANAYQVLQGLYAIASGGLFGTGWGESIQKLGYIPEAYNDMIFAIICEEMGLVGAMAVLILFVLLLWRILLIACRAPDLFGGMICMGVLIHIAVQVVLNVAVVTNSIPSTGVPLPFVSYGGTASAIMMAEMGLVLGVSGKDRWNHT